MIGPYQTGRAFRAALEARLKRAARDQNIDLMRLRRQVAFDRLLARLFAQPDAPWMLKGGYTFELRLGGRARATKDLDLSIPDLRRLTVSGAESLAPSALIRERLQDVAAARWQGKVTNLARIGHHNGQADNPQIRAELCRIASSCFNRDHLGERLEPPHELGNPRRRIGQMPSFAARSDGDIQHRFGHGESDAHVLWIAYSFTLELSSRPTWPGLAG